MGVDVTIINIVGKNGGLEFLDPGFSLNRGSKSNKFKCIEFWNTQIQN